ncbi:MAG TPA: acyloxyacyl hydrolase [Thermoanaerobaculia bacterium]|jgi:hypothetical protein
MKAARRPLALLLLFFFASELSAQTEPPLPENRPPEWGAEAGYGFLVHLNRGRSHEHLLLFEPSVGLRIGSRFEYVIEGHFAQYLTPKGYMIGLLPLGARYYIGNGRLLPYLSAGAGLGWTDLTPLDEIDRRFNFLLQGSLGVRGALPDGQAWTFEARLDHISNAGLARPNLGLNCAVFLLGWRFR